jgi:hypothetical protein
VVLDDSAGVVDLSIRRQIDAATVAAERFERGGDLGGETLNAGQVVGVAIDARPPGDKTHHAIALRIDPTELVIDRIHECISVTRAAGAAHAENPNLHVIGHFRITRRDVWGS